MTLDLIVRGGTVIDGSGSDRFVADIGLVDGRIAEVGDLSSRSAEAEIDADGLWVTPGFVDMHSHADLILLADRSRRIEMLEAKLRQGITTIVLGNCGLGPAPASPDAATILQDVNAWMTPENVRSPAGSVADYLNQLDSLELPLNVATLAPHGPIRMSVMGLGPGDATEAQLQQMESALDLALEQGAFGLSFGLIYPPGMFTSTDELVRLARRAKLYDGLVSMHIRGSSTLLLPATRELIEVSRASGARLHHSHLEAVGADYWPQIERVLELEDQARADGLDISHDMFPYSRAATMMVAIFPPWALDGGVPALLNRLRDPELRQRMRHQMESLRPVWPPWKDGSTPHNLVAAVGWDGILVANLPENADASMLGKSIAALASGAGVEPFDFVADLMLEHEGRIGQQVREISGDGASPGELARILRHPAGAIVTDAEDVGRGSPHPAHAGAMVRALRWNREADWLTDEMLIHKMSGYPAKRVGLSRRGELVPGYAADLLLIDPTSIQDRATWREPRRHASGIHTVLINGQVVIAPEATSPLALAGTVLRKSHN